MAGAADDIVRRLAGGESLEEIGRSLRPPAWRPLLRACAVAHTFNGTLFEGVLRPFAARSGDAGPPTLAELVAARAVVPADDGTGAYCLPHSDRAAYFLEWFEPPADGGLDPLGESPDRLDVPAELARLEELIAGFRAAAGDDVRELRHLLLSDPEGAEALFRERFAAADERRDFALCQDLVDVLGDPDRLPLSDPGLERLRLDRAGHVRVRAYWAADYARSAQFLSPPGLERDAERLLSGRDRVWQVHAPGGTGKTMQLRWLVARHCVTAEQDVPCARIDFDVVNPHTAGNHPWLLLLEMAEQFGRRLPGSPFARLDQFDAFRVLLGRSPGDTARTAARNIATLNREGVQEEVLDVFATRLNLALAEAGGVGGTPGAGPWPETASGAGTGNGAERAGGGDTGGGTGPAGGAATGADARTGADERDDEAETQPGAAAGASAEPGRRRPAGAGTGAGPAGGAGPDGGARGGDEPSSRDGVTTGPGRRTGGGRPTGTAADTEARTGTDDESRTRAADGAGDGAEAGTGTGTRAADGTDTGTGTGAGPEVSAGGGRPAVLVLDTLEEVLLRGQDGLAALLDLLGRLLDRCPGLRVVLSGRYDLRERAPDALARLGPHPSCHRVVRPFDTGQSLAYLTGIRRVHDRDIAAAAARRSQGLPFVLALFADLIEQDPELTAGELERCDEPLVRYLIDRVVRRIDDPAVRWLLRYGVVPRRLRREDVRTVMRPWLVRGISGDHPDDDDPRRDHHHLRGRSDLFPQDPAGLTEGELDRAWRRLLEYTARSSWVSRPAGDDSMVVFHPNVIVPMRQLISDKPVFLSLHRDFAARFTELAGGDPAQWVAYTREALYHRFQGGDAEAEEDWVTALTGLTGEDNAAARALGEEVLGEEYVEEGLPRRGRDGRPLISHQAVALAHLTIAFCLLEVADRESPPSPDDPLWGEIESRLRGVDLLREHGDVSDRTKGMESLLRANVLLARGHRPEALELIDGALRTEGDGSRLKRMLLLMRARAQLAAGSVDAAEDTFHEVLLSARGGGDAQYAARLALELADESTTRGRHDRAAELQGAALAQDTPVPLRIETVFREARTRLSVFAPTAALRILDGLGHTLAEQPDRAAEADSLRAEALRMLGRSRRALAALERADAHGAAAGGPEAEPRAAGIVTARARLHGECLEVEQAESCLERAAGIEAGMGFTFGRPPLLLTLTRFLARDVGDLHRASGVLDQADEADTTGEWAVYRGLLRQEIAARSGAPAADGPSAVPGGSDRDLVLGGVAAALRDPGRIPALAAALAAVEPPAARLAALYDLVEMPLPEPSVRAGLARLVPLFDEAVEQPPPAPEDRALRLTLRARLHAVTGDAERARRDLNEGLTVLAPGHEDDPLILWRHVKSLLWLGIRPNSALLDRLEGAPTRPSGLLPGVARVLRAVDRPGTERIVPLLLDSVTTANTVLTDTVWEAALLWCTARLNDDASTMAAAGQMAASLGSPLPSAPDGAGPAGRRFGLPVPHPLDGPARPYGDDGGDVGGHEAPVGTAERDGRSTGAWKRLARVVRTLEAVGPLPAVLGQDDGSDGGPVLVGSAPAAAPSLESLLTAPGGDRIVTLGRSSLLDRSFAPRRIADALLSDRAGAQHDLRYATAPRLDPGAPSGRLRLEAEDPRVHALPWELLAGPDDVPYRTIPSAAVTADVRTLQSALNQSSRDRLVTDGVWGRLTQDALAAAALGPLFLPVTGGHLAMRAVEAIRQYRDRSSRADGRTAWLVRPPYGNEESARRGGGLPRAQHAYSRAGFVSMVTASLGRTRQSGTPRVLHIAVPLAQIGQAPCLDFGSEHTPYPGGTRVGPGELAEVLSRFAGRPPLVVLDPPCPGSPADIPHQLVLRNLFAAQLFASGTAPVVLGTGLYRRTHAYQVVLARALAAGEPLLEIARLLRHGVPRDEPAGPASSLAWDDDSMAAAMTALFIAPSLVNGDAGEDG
ncbi:tetratricopeptide repeat protein [Streptomyces sp. SID8352]|uniref:tetratricopeptide repeat protein n=1 Tax=Streptomyces sp. SID8352 TaxID=2690338 RepID=UPI00136B93DC|nr:tetratricopeptide repeat protein [Streptomyces sp. SID8352]MYU21819.1 hypothetical protein [Streptomyces sp. SID8352]